MSFTNVIIQPKMKKKPTQTTYWMEQHRMSDPCFEGLLTIGSCLNVRPEQGPSIGRDVITVKATERAFRGPFVRQRI